MRPSGRGGSNPAAPANSTGSRAEPAWQPSTAAGLPHYELGRKIARGLVGGGIKNGRDEQPAGEIGVLPDCRQSGRAEAAEEHVVVADHRDVLWNLQAGTAERANGAERNQVARRDDPVD